MKKKKSPKRRNKLKKKAIVKRRSWIIVILLSYSLQKESFMEKLFSENFRGSLAYVIWTRSRIYSKKNTQILLRVTYFVANFFFFFSFFRLGTSSHRKEFGKSRRECFLDAKATTFTSGHRSSRFYEVHEYLLQITRLGDEEGTDKNSVLGQSEGYGLSGLPCAF